MSKLFDDSPYTKHKPSKGKKQLSKKTKDEVYGVCINCGIHYIMFSGHVQKCIKCEKL